uniref:ATP synthase complex subunit 8 n=1 Tax=Fieberiella septentrionalis TaxID=1978376 RepID=A0A890CBZ0_9HEMI|nr:ATP synthase F0 subunit 8 [Fieberiella septentrionalis]QRG29284.1 ATP synthase F0 subunit 8 [Fieberiella septentrionalis]
MPQMSPIWWLTLMITTLALMLLYMSLTYFNNKPEKKMETKKYYKWMNWKW